MPLFDAEWSMKGAHTGAPLQTDASARMPKHIHKILIIVEATPHIIYALIHRLCRNISESCTAYRKVRLVCIYPVQRQQEDHRESLRAWRGHPVRWRHQLTTASVGYAMDMGINTDSILVIA